MVVAKTNIETGASDIVHLKTLEVLRIKIGATSYDITEKDGAMRIKSHGGQVAVESHSQNVVSVFDSRPF